MFFSFLPSFPHHWDSSLWIRDEREESGGRIRIIQKREREKSLYLEKREREEGIGIIQRVGEREEEAHLASEWEESIHVEKGFSDDVS